MKIYEHGSACLRRGSTQPKISLDLHQMCVAVVIIITTFIAHFGDRQYRHGPHSGYTDSLAGVYMMHTPSTYLAIDLIYIYSGIFRAANFR